ncbi:MAG: hypothetical protein AABX11_06605 [Nanoarchaeota archaeon]
MDFDLLKQKGKRLLSDGCALGDTSGRTKNLEEKSVFAITSKNFEFTILMIASEKQKVYKKLSKKYNENRAKTLIHATKIFFAIKSYLNTCPAFYICSDGFDPGLVKYYLKQLLQRSLNNSI